jgi:uncharacterized membrane protein YoaK (UPF0700 family)/anti-anti-sigma regulatory factor
MMSAHAYSFRQKSRLAISLSWIAGYTNVVSLIVSAQMVSHMTGNTTWLGRLFLNPGDADASHAFWSISSLLGSFLLGAVASALMTEHADRAGLSSRYIAPMAAEAMLLAAYSICLIVWGRAHGFVQMGHISVAPPPPPVWVACLASFAMGIQNATITKISGSVVRSTHVTGVVTDFGLESVQLFLWWRDKTRISRRSRYGRVFRVSQRHPSVLRLALLASIFGSFLFGATVGARIYYHFAPEAMLIPIFFLIWIVLVDYRKPIGYVTEMDLMGDPELAAFGIVKSILPLELGIFRMGHRRKDAMHHAPNFQLWVNRLPAHWRVVILALSPLTKFDSESLTDLRTAAVRLKQSHRRLIISGINPAQFRLMDAVGLLDVLESADISPDLEFAIARGIDLIEQTARLKNHISGLTL